MAGSAGQGAGARALAAVRNGNEALNTRLFRRGEFLRHYKLLARSALQDARTALHLGAGRGAIDETWRLFRDPPAFSGVLIALDLDGNELRKNSCARRVQGNAEALPVRSGSIDVIVCEYVFEHLENPTAVLAECRRVLKRAGLFVFTTPNRWSYIALVARATPLAFHYLLSRLRGASHEEMYETYYRLNTVGAISAAARDAGLVIKEVRTFAGEPNYTTFLPGLHLGFIVLHKLLERFRWLEPFRTNIVGVLAKE
jgi:ubiquinone/menaquinone biosynthesis C-methylase UbiE